MSADSLFLFSDLKNQVCLNLGATDDISQAKSEKYINRALMRFSEMGTWSWQRVFDQDFPGLTSVTVASTHTYTVRSCLELHSLYISSGNKQKLYLMGDREFRAAYPDPSATGQPYLYLHRGRANTASELDSLKVRLYPTPDAAYTLKWDGVRGITLLALATQDVRVVTGMPSTMVDLLIEMATAIGWKEIDDAVAREQMSEASMRLDAMWKKDSHSIEDIHIMRGFEGVDYMRDPVLPPQYD